jgi:hypothetical protein
MKKIFFLILTVVMLGSSAFPEQLGNAVRISSQTGTTRWSQCAFTSDGTLHVVFEQRAPAGHPVWYVSYDGTTISTPFNLAAGLNVENYKPNIAAGPKGMIVAVWGNESIDGVYMRVYDPKKKSWLPAEVVRAERGFEEPMPAIDKDGNIYIWWFDDRTGIVWSRSKIDNVWENTVLLSMMRGIDGAIAAGPDGTVWSVWREKESGRYTNYYSKRTKSTGWARRKQVTDLGDSTSHPYIAVGPNNVAVIAWGNVGGNLGASIRVWRLEVDTVRELVIPTRMQHYPRLAIDKDNNIHMAVQIGGGDFGDGFVYTNNVGGSWKDVQTFGAMWPKVQGISTEPSGNVAVCQTHISVEASEVWVYSLRKIQAISFIAPLNLASDISIARPHASPEITYNLSWAANPRNNENYLESYQIYMKEGDGEYQPLLAVSKSTFLAALKFAGQSTKRLFAIAAMGNGIESDMVVFQ